MTKFSLVIPAYNEGTHIESTVKGIVRALEKIGSEFELMVVDNGSTDNTTEVLFALQKEIPQVSIVRVFPNQGKGNGILAGLARASGDVLGFMDADNQVDPARVLDVYHALVSESLDFCKTVRIERRESLFRILQSAVYNFLFRILFGGDNRDINSSPKIFTREFYERLDLTSRDWFLDPEIMIKGMRMGAKMGEVEVIWDSRKGGSSHVSLFTALEFVKNMILYKFFGGR